MARTKTRYREFGDGGRVDQAELPIDQPTERPVEFVSAAPEAPAVDSQPEPPAQAEPQPEPQQQNDATLALKRQIENLRQSEKAQRQQAAMPAQPMSREQRLAAWQAEGISPAEANFFVRNPEMLDWPQVTGFVIHKALEAGHPRGSDAHFDFVKKAFDANLAHLQAQAAQPAMQPTTPTPAFFKPPPGRPAANPSSKFSAPVSREVPNSTGKRITPGKVTLTPQEVEAARISGISLEEYAKQKIRKADMIASGEYGEQPR